MYVCLYICMYVYVHVCLYIYIFVCMYICMYVCMCLCIYICMYVCMYVCIYMCIYVCMYVLCMCVLIEQMLHRKNIKTLNLLEKEPHVFNDPCCSLERTVPFRTDRNVERQHAELQSAVQHDPARSPSSAV